MRVTIVKGPPQEVQAFGDELSGQMSSDDVEVVREIFSTPLTGSYNWDYEAANAKIRRLYELGKKFNWNAELDVDWAVPFPRTESPDGGVQDAVNGFAANPKYQALSPEQKVEFAWRSQAQTLSQFLHGEQGALLVAAQLVSCAPTYDAKLYAASQTFDEARHVEVFHRYLKERCKLIYPINENLKLLLDKVLTDPRWDYLEDWIKALPQKEIERLAQFAYEACVIMRERLFSTAVAEEFGFTAAEARQISIDSDGGRAFRNFLFERMIPNLKRVGLLTDSVRPKFEALGVLQYENLAHDGMIDWVNLERPLPTRENLAAAQIAAQ